MKNTDYEKQANDFLSKTNTKISSKYIKNGFYFERDKGTRDIYEITIMRGSRKIIFTFGNSIVNSQYYNDKRYNGKRTYSLNGKERTGGYSILDIEKYKNGGMELELIKGIPPTNYSILSCLQKNEVGTFEDFCGEFGYSEDSRTAEKIYKTVCKEYNNVCKIWNDEEIEELQEIN